MNKAVITGIIIAIIAIIGVISTLSYKSNAPAINNEETITTGDALNTTTIAEPAKSQGKHITIELTESVGITSNP